MASEFDFLRAKWPKLAAMAGDASRLADISPTTAMKSLRTYCEWCADIALDLYEIQVPGGASQIEKLEALQASGYVPAEILQKFHNVRSAGNRVSSDIGSGIDLANACLSDSRDIGQWLFREADKEGWPRNEGYAPAYGRVPIEGMTAPMSDPENMTNDFKMSKFMRKYGSYITLLLAVIIIVGAIVGITMLFNKNKEEKKPAEIVLDEPPSVTMAPTKVVAPKDTPVPTEVEEPYELIDDIPMLDNSFPVGYITTRKWDYKSKQDPFVIKGRTYTSGLGMFIESDSMETSAHQEAYWNLDGKFNKISFDLGPDDTWSYGSYDERGSFRIFIYADDKLIYPDNIASEAQADALLYSTDIQDKIVLLPEGTLQLKISLSQRKGTKGTLCVVMGEVKLYYADDAQQ